MGKTTPPTGDAPAEKPASEAVSAKVVTLDHAGEKTKGYFLDGQWYRAVDGPDIPCPAPDSWAERK